MFNPKDYLTPKDIQEMVGITNIELIWKWIREGRLKSFKFGRIYLVDKKEFTLFWKSYEPNYRRGQKIAAKRKK